MRENSTKFVLDKADLKTVVIGGGSRLARHLKAVLPVDSKYICRNVTDAANEVAATSYLEYHSELLSGASTVVNCVGTATGSESTMRNVNVHAALYALEAAISAGAQHFIQISSLSVYGKATELNLRTPEMPSSSYGRSKKTADDELHRRAKGKIKLSIIRLPMLYDLEGPSKLKMLMKIWSMLGFFVMPRGDVRRSMMGYALAAEVITRVASSPEAVGKIIAADPVPFSFTKAMHSTQKNHYGNLKLIRLPQLAVIFIKYLSPSLYYSLLQSSFVEHNENYAVQACIVSHLYSDLSFMIAPGSH